MSDTDTPHTLPNRTTPTWEVELLISGIAVFAMLQLPSLLDNVMFALEPRLDNDWQQPLVLAYLYGKGMAVILAITFVLHLLLRARWIALVGMYSVYPDGIRWDKLRIGPIQGEVERERALPFPTIIDRADNLATTVFAVGVMLGILVVVIAVVALFISVFGILLSTLSDRRIDGYKVILAVFATVMVPFSLIVLYDRKRGARLAPDSRVRHIIRRLFGWYARIGLSRMNNPIMSLLGSHGSDYKVVAFTTTLLMLVLFAVGASFAVMQSPQWLGNYGLFPSDKGTTAIDAAHYDDQRDPARDPALPYIQSMAVTAAPYLRLVVPYRPMRDEPAMRRICAQAQALPNPRQAEVRLACLSTLHGVTLDGEPLADMRYEIASDPRTDRPALLAMIDVRGLPRGRHELRIARPSTDDEDNDAKDDPGYDQILFWR
ncbi:hypothetical protein [Thermomonas sp. HDW16]|uniref:hypothetical protein n=1 Tax=Thermomonas sp. HDW16 TaxID=2714945 RepID=UPI00140B6CCF|nr:hypothetical protein [Thermomonas sp. HDW16]QIL20768.1 hypothetical protein G7079_08485 [Thermomonas sp. HDW16]